MGCGNGFAGDAVCGSGGDRIIFGFPLPTTAVSVPEQSNWGDDGDQLRLCRFDGLKEGRGATRVFVLSVV